MVRKNRKIDKKLKKLKKLGREYGGHLRANGSLKFALEVSKGKGKYRQLAYLWRAIIVDHPFTDANKRTAMRETLRFMKEHKIEITQKKIERITKAIIKVAKQNLTNLNLLERRIRNAIK
ncbi:MAG: Fic family protein [Candidatus Pacearchaeota archaeon]|nr:MAG: Fic family protein [Candidatus Pacearchaeota archaeon]